MKRIFSDCIFILLLLLPSLVWAQDDAPFQLAPPSERGGQPGQIQMQSTVGQDSSAAGSTEVTALPAAPMFPDSLMKNYEVETFQGVLKMADLTSFAYNDVLAKAKTGDAGSIYQLLDFSRIVDGKDGVNHSVTILEIIPLAGDEAFSAAASQCKPKLKKMVLDRLIQAQSRTKKEFLRQSMEHWAPTTWAVLNGLPVPDGENPPSSAGETQPTAPSIQKDATSPKKQ
jgi:hypothetical protein